MGRPSSLTMADSLRQPCANATQAFLRKDYVQSLFEIEKALNVSSEGISTSLEQLLVLRFTVVYTVYAHATVRHRVTEALQEAESEHAPKLKQMLSMSPGPLFVQLWYECVYALAQDPVPDSLPSSLALTPVAEQVLLHIPVPVLSSAILMALRMDVFQDAEASSSTRSQNARQLCECFFSAVVQADETFQDTDKYERILRLYAIQVLGTYLGEWEYACGFVEYSTLPPPTKLDVLNALSAARENFKHKMEQETQVLRHAQKHYESERSKRGAEVPPTDTPSAQTAPVPVARPSETIVRPTVQRTPSVRARPASLTTDSPSPHSSHADQLQHLQRYVHRRPSAEPVDASVPPRSSSWWSLFLSYITRERTLSTIVVLVVALLLRSSSGRQGIQGPGWSSVVKQRLLDTLRMYVWPRTH